MHACKHRLKQVICFLILFASSLWVVKVKQCWCSWFLLLLHHPQHHRKHGGRQGYTEQQNCDGCGQTLADKWWLLIVKRGRGSEGWRTSRGLGRGRGGGGQNWTLCSCQQPRPEPCARIVSRRQIQNKQPFTSEVNLGLWEEARGHGEPTQRHNTQIQLEICKGLEPRTFWLRGKSADCCATE